MDPPPPDPVFATSVTPFRPRLSLPLHYLHLHLLIWPFPYLIHLYSSHLSAFSLPPLLLIFFLCSSSSSSYSPILPSLVFLFHIFSFLCFFSVLFLIYALRSIHEILLVTEKYLIQKERDHWEDQDVGGWTILKWILER
jgi:hypothetical protein